MQACRFLELHVVDGCNLACDSCAHFANYLSGGMLSPADAESQMAAWSPRLSPSFFNMFGGEPCLNPDLISIVELALQYWPGSIRQVMSNGVLLDDIPGLGIALKSTSTGLVVTRHAPGDPIDYATLQEFIDLGVRVSLLCADGNPPPDGFAGTVKTKRWTRRYDDLDGKPVPIPGEDMTQSWLHCPCRGFIQLRGGMLYKCPTVAYLPAVQAELGALDGGWDPVLSYNPLPSGCTDDELAAFLAEGENPACAACSLNPLPSTADGQPVK